MANLIKVNMTYPITNFPNWIEHVNSVICTNYVIEDIKTENNVLPNTEFVISNITSLYQSQVATLILNRFDCVEVSILNEVRYQKSEKILDFEFM